MAKESKFNTHVMNVAAVHQNKLQREVGTNWWYQKSKTAKLLTGLNELGFYATLLINLIVCLSYVMLLNINSVTQNWAAERAMLKSALGAFCFGTFLVILGYVLKKISRRRVKRQGVDTTPLMLISSVAFVVGCVFLFITAYDVLVVANADNMYAEAVEGSTPFKIYVELICFHALPLFFMLLSSVLFYVMHRCDFKEKKQIYDRMTDTLYKDFVKNNPNYTVEQWEECLNSFEGYDSPSQKDSE